MMSELTWWQSLIIVFIAAVVMWGIIGPWISLFSLNGIERELGKIRQELERQKGAR